MTLCRRSTFRWIRVWSVALVLESSGILPSLLANQLTKSACSSCLSALWELRW